MRSVITVSPDSRINVASLVSFGEEFIAFFTVPLVITLIIGFSHCGIEGSQTVQKVLHEDGRETCLAEGSQTGLALFELQSCR